MTELLPPTSRGSAETPTDPGLRGRGLLLTSLLVSAASSRKARRADASTPYATSAPPLPAPGDDLQKPVNLIDTSRTPSADRTGRVIDIVLVTAPRCHFCEEAKGALAELAQRYPLRIRQVDLAEPEGIALVRRFRVPFPPIVMIDGEFFGHGRISRRKLEATLAALVSDGR